MQPYRCKMIAWLALAVAVVVLSSACQAAPSARDAQLAAQARAATARAEEQALAQSQAAAIAKLRVAEAATDVAVAKISDLAHRRNLVAARLNSREADIAPLIPALYHLDRDPIAVLASITLPAGQALAGARLVGALSRQITLDAARARTEQAELDRLQAAFDAELPLVAAAQIAQAQAAGSLDLQLRRTAQNRREAEDEAAAAARQLALDVAHAETVTAAIARIEAAHDRRELATIDQRKPARAAVSQNFTAPVLGAITRHFGDATDAGAATGITYQPAPGALVVAPCGGRVVYAGTFRSFGILLIIDCGGGTHVVLSGFERLDAQVGRGVASGAPVGVMPGWNPHASKPRPLLYVEVRRAGRVIDPLPVLAGKIGL